MFANLRMSGYRHPYDETETTDKNPCDMDLDPISVPGCDWEKLIEKSTAMPLLAQKVTKIMAGDNTVIGFSGRCQSKIPVTAKKWEKQLKHLLTWGIISSLGKGNKSLWVSGYFSVAKDLEVARAIMSGGGLSRECNTPESVNIMDIREILRFMTSLRARSLVFSHLDLRHWFYQLKISGKLKTLFHTVCNGTTYEWNRLVMGWSWSPFLCQIIAWLLYLHRESGDEQIFEEPSGDKAPRFLKLTKGPGFATVLYDNFAIISDDQSALDNAQKRLRRNLDLFSVIVKPGSEKSYTNKEMRIDLKRDNTPNEETDDEKLQCTAPIHLGVQCGVAEHGVLRMAWRADPKKIAVWRRDPPPAMLAPARLIARFVGRIIWHHSLRLCPLITIEPILHIARSLGQYVGTTYKKWDDVFALSEKTHLDLHNCWMIVLENQWIFERRPIPKQKLFLFTDASNTGWAYVLTTVTGIVIEHKKFVWKSGSASESWHIFIKEMAASLWSLSICNKIGVEFVVFVDNVAAEHCLRRGFSSNLIANELMRGAQLESIRYESRRIHTSINPADKGSRGLECDIEKTLHTVQHLDLLVICGKVGPCVNEYSVRHIEVADADHDEEYIKKHIEEILFDPTKLPHNTYRPVQEQV